MKHQENIPETMMDEQLAGLFASVGTERAPAGFTQYLMQKIEQEKASGFVYKPVISKAAWVAIGVIIAAVILVSVFAFPDAGSTSSLMQKLTGNFSFPLSGGSLFHVQNRLLQFFSGSNVLLSVLAVAVVLGWHYLFMQSRSIVKQNRFSGMPLF